jgi:hypothetical protein
MSPRNELNPNHPVTVEIREQWHKLLAVLMHKFGLTEVEITVDDLLTLEKSGLMNITAHPKGDVITLRLVSDAEAARLAREEGGLPI